MTDLPAALTLHDVTLAHGSRVLFAQANLTLPAGSFTVLDGANGHGKTTLLRTLLGLHRPQQGRIEVLGRNPAAIRGQIGYMPQDRRLPAPQMTGHALLAASWRGASFGLPGWGGKLNARIGAALSLTGAEVVARQPLSQLSGGERQRLFLAEALLDSPSLLVLDEPLSGMDTQWQTRILSMLHKRCRDTGMSVLMSCHGLDAVRPFADHLLRISDQKLELHDAAL